MEKRTITWTDVYSFMEDTVFEVRKRIDNKNTEIFTFYRGGLPLATLFSNLFNNINFNIIKYQTRDGNDKEPVLMNNNNLCDGLKWCYSNNKDIVFIEDIIDTGKTFEPIFKILEELTKEYPLYKGNIVIITLVNNYNISIRNIKNTRIYSLYSNEQDIWFVFPWEQQENKDDELEEEELQEIDISGIVEFDDYDLINNIRETFDTCLNILEMKNHDYNNSRNPLMNFFDVEKLGISAEQGILVRLNDKFNRIVSLMNKKNKVKDESIDDTINDAINYFALLKEVLKEKRRNLI